jgi:aminotransferase
MTQEEFAHAVAVTFSTVNRWENGHAKPSKLARRAIEALARPDSDIGEMVDEYRRRRNFIAAAFNEMGIECHRPLGAFYAFPSIAKFGLPSKDFALKLLNEEKVAVVPGTAFGACGEGFVRCAYATSMENLKEAMARLRRFIGKQSAKQVALLR